MAGQTKWKTWGLWNFALDGLLSFSTVPLRVWTYFGAFIATLAFVYGSFIVIRTLLWGVDMPGYASLFTAVLFLGGIQLLSIGIIGEYIGRMFIEMKRRPLYVVEGSYSAEHPPVKVAQVRNWGNLKELPSSEAEPEIIGTTD
jgi:glycosyltransferase involved in cell wall biosynthesis